MLATLRSDNAVVPGSRRGRSWKDLSAPLSPLAKTLEYNDFLSLLSSQGKPSKTAFPDTPVTMSTTITQSSPLPSESRTQRALYEPPPFGLNPKRRALGKRGKPSVKTEVDDIDLIQSPIASGEESDSKEISPVEKNDESNPDFDMLIDDFESKVVLRDQAVASSRAITLPKNFELEHPITHEAVFNEKKKIRAHLKRKRDDGTHPTTRDKGGYIPQELLSYGAVALLRCRSSALDNEIHPLLGRSQFDDTPDVIYDQITPALRLASLWLSQPSCMQFWVTLALAPRMNDQTMSQKYGRPCQRIAKHVPMTAANTKQVIQHLHHLGTSDLVHFRFQPRLRSNNSRIYGVSLPICSRTSEHTSHHTNAPNRNKLTPSLIRLHSDAYISAHKLSQLSFPEPSQTLRFHFFLATLLLHELAHSIEGAYIRHRPDQHTHFINEGVYMEPFWMDWTRVPEMGRAWEETTLGGEVQPINWRVDGGCGIGTADWPPRGSAGDVERRVWWGVGMSYIESLFQKSTWMEREVVATKGKQDIFADGVADWLKIPRNGACSLYINFFTTMTSSEARRVKEEEAHEALEKAREMPPDKVRVKGSGGKEEKRKEAEEVIERVVKEVQEVEVRVRNAEKAIEDGVLLTSTRQEGDDEITADMGEGSSITTDLTPSKTVEPTFATTTSFPSLPKPTASSLSSQETTSIRLESTEAERLQSISTVSLNPPTTSDLILMETPNSQHTCTPGPPITSAVTILDQQYGGQASDDEDDDSDYEPSIHDNDNGDPTIAKQRNPDFVNADVVSSTETTTRDPDRAERKGRVEAAEVFSEEKGEDV